MHVSAALIQWYRRHHRALPWRQTSDAYIIWLSEIILQQTRVNQGLPYFERFRERFPDVRSLAEASENEILKLWQGLGYYSRAVNMHQAAKKVTREFKGRFPVDFDELKALPGVGDYTAAAIASFAGNRPHAVVDGNVFRVLSRYYNESVPINTSEGRKVFSRLAAEILDVKHPGLHNQAIMELGALVCKPVSPLCGECPLMAGCGAFHAGSTGQLPVKQKKGTVRNRYFNYLLVRRKKNIFLNKRGKADIWKNLYDLPLIETSEAGTPGMVMESDAWKSYFRSGTFQVSGIRSFPVHKLSHQSIHARVFEITLSGKPERVFTGSFVEIDESEAGTYPVSRLVETILTDCLDSGR